MEFVASALRKKGLVSESDEREIFIKGDAQRARLKKAQEQSYTSKRRGAVGEFISPAEVIAALNFSVPGTTGRPLTEDMITEAIAAEVGLPYKKIDPLKINADVATSFIPRPFAQKHLIVPIEEKDKVVTVALADPYNLDAIEGLQSTGKVKLKLVLASKSDILMIIREFYGFRYSVGAAEKEVRKDTELSNLEQYVKLKGAVELDATDQHVINAVEYLLHYAYEQRASDIHIEPKREKTVVRLRIDGVLHYIHTIPKPVHPSVVSRIKMLSRMDIAEKRKPQDGRIKTSFKDKEVELRVSTLPTAFGEKVVIRIFDPELLLQEVATLGFTPKEFEVFNAFLKKTFGIILVTGPTGSGKTTTLYSALKTLSTPEVNIVTIEDPIEMVVEEFNQVGVQSQIGMDFASSLRTILRQDPDIIMVGEIRDAETANNAVQAALTGHLVLSTLHTNDAPTSITRLMDLGIPPFLINSTIIGIAAQRLVRKICKSCSKERLLTADEVEYLRIRKDREYKVCYGEGCNECRGTGYRGRVAIYELLEFTDKIRAFVTTSTDLAAVGKAAREQGMSSLRESAMRKMLSGVTTYEEVISVT